MVEIHIAKLAIFRIHSLLEMFVVDDGFESLYLLLGGRGFGRDAVFGCDGLADGKTADGSEAGKGGIAVCVRGTREERRKKEGEGGGKCGNLPK